MNFEDIDTMVIWNFEQFSDKIALVDDAGQAMTYQDLMSHGAYLAEMIGERCLVFSLCTNSIGSVLGYTAFLEHEIVPVLLNAHLERDLLHDLLDTYQPEYVWLPEDMSEAFLIPDASDMEHVYEDVGYVLLKNACAKRVDMYPELGLLLTTSGSTGSPKFVRQSYRNIKANAESIVEYLELDDTERPVTTLPMNYTYGLSIINSHLLVGATILLTDHGLMQKEFWRFMKDQAATSFGGVPYTYEMLDRLRFFRMDLPALRTMTQAGGKLSPELHKKFAEYALEQGKHFVVMYGQTEATARMGYLPCEQSLKKYGSMGIAIPGGKLWLRDVGGNSITEPDVVGELVYEGANVTLGYAECRADLVKGDERHGVLETGDMAKCDADGFFYIVGRKKRFLKVFGNRLNLDELDRMIKKQFPDLDCASSGKDDRVEIYVTAEGKGNEIRTFVSEKTGLHLSAFSVYPISEIPKNDAGKVLYKELWHE